MISSIDLFLSRDWGGGAGPDVELAKRVGPAPAPVPVPAPAPVAVVLAVPNAEVLGAEEVPKLGPFFTGPEVAVAVVDAEDAVTLAFPKRLRPGFVDAFRVSAEDAAVVAAGDGAWLEPAFEDPKAGNRLALKGVLAGTGSANGCDVLTAVSDCVWSNMSATPFIS